MRRTYLPTLRQKIVLITLTRPNYSIFEQYSITLTFPVHYSIFLFVTLDNSTWKPLDSHKRRDRPYCKASASTGVLAVIFYCNVTICSPGKDTICQHCGRDFKVLGRHVWRCKARIFTDQPTAPPNNHMVTAQETVNYVESADLSPVNLNNLHNENLLGAYIIYITNYDKELQDEGPKNLCRDTEMECCFRKKLKRIKRIKRTTKVLSCWFYTRSKYPVCPRRSDPMQ